MSTALRAMYAPRRTIAGGTTRKPAAAKSYAGPNLEGTLS